MKRLAACLLVVLMLTGCSGDSGEMESGIALRSRLLQSSGCSFVADVTADYGDRIQIFTMECQSNDAGNITFAVSKPDTISGIAGRLTGEGGQLIFDDTALHFPLLAEDRYSPISGPWVLLQSLRSGFLTSACTEEDMIRLSADHSLNNDTLNLDIWLDEDHMPAHADILHNGRRILQIAVRNFVIL